MRQERVREVSPLASSSPLLETLCPTHPSLKSSHLPGEMGHLEGLMWLTGLEKNLCKGRVGRGGQGGVVKGR